MAKKEIVMKKNITNMSIKIGLLLSLIVSGATALENNGTSTVSNTNNTIVKSDKVKLIDIAGKQRMLSQRIAKDYIYQGKKIATSKASKQLKVSLGEFSKAHKYLLSSINDPEIVNLLAFVEMSIDDFKTIVNQPFNLDNAQLALDLSESMLEGSQYVVDSLTSVLNHRESNIVAKAGKQRMLAQRIAKYYISYQAGIKDKNSIYQMEEAVKTFSLNLNELMKNSTNTPQILNI